MKTNTKTKQLRTHEGAVAKHISKEAQLRRSVMSCLLWESEFYESGETIADRITKLVAEVPAPVVASIAVEARSRMNLRHVPLWIVKAMAALPTHKLLVARTLEEVIQRPDELTEFVSLYFKDGRKPLSAQIKKGLAKAFCKFNAYSLAKYNRDGAVKLRDVLFLCHAKPKDDQQVQDWKQLANGTLAAPDTWEVALSSGADKRESWTRLLSENKLGGLALLRNLRNMEKAGVGRDLVRKSVREMSTARILPFRFIAAAAHAPYLEPELEEAMFRNTSDMEKLSGRTHLLVDVSISMGWQLSGKSDLKRSDAASGLAMLLREVCESVSIYTFSDKLVEVPARRGFALAEAIDRSQAHSGTELGAAVRGLLREAVKPGDRLIVITDEQSIDPVPDPHGVKAYMLNVASAKNGIGYGPWIHLDGFSEAIVNYIIQSEG